MLVHKGGQINKSGGGGVRVNVYRELIEVIVKMKKKVGGGPIGVGGQGGRKKKVEGVWLGGGGQGDVYKELIEVIVKMKKVGGGGVRSVGGGGGGGQGGFE